MNIWLINGKKGMTQKTIIEILLAIVSALILMLVLGQFGDILTDTTPREICKVSAYTRSAYFEKNIAFQKIFGIPSLKCKTEYDCLATGSGCSKPYITTKVKDAEGIKKEIAGNMYNCWDNFGEGKIDPIGGSFNLGSNVCLICSRIKFDDKAKSEIKQVNNLVDYLSTNKIPGKNITYSQFLTRSNKPNALGAEYKIDLSKEYAVVYTVYAPGYAAKVGAAATGALVGGSTIAIVFGTGGTAAIVFGGVAGAYGVTELQNLWESWFDLDKPIFSLTLTEYNANELSRGCSEIISIA